MHCRQLHSGDAEAVGGAGTDQEDRIDLLQIGLTVKDSPPRSISRNFFTHRGEPAISRIHIYLDPELLKADLLDLDLGS